MLTVATTVAPASFAHWTSAPATPPEAEGTSTSSPGRISPSRFTMCQAVLTAHCPAAMASGSSDGWSGITTSAGTLTSSPYPPQRVVPKISKAAQRSGRHLAHWAHRPQLYCWNAVTRSPAWTGPASAPVPTTVPVNSAPRTIGSLNDHRDVPARESRSEWLTPQACTRMRTSRGPVTGSGISAYCMASGGPYS